MKRPKNTAYLVQSGPATSMANFEQCVYTNQEEQRLERANQQVCQIAGNLIPPFDQNYSRAIIRLCKKHFGNVDCSLGRQTNF